MTQPPPRPSGPPEPSPPSAAPASAGFGAPAGPPPGGYGTTPPPGYGFPQEPPAGQPGYPGGPGQPGGPGHGYPGQGGQPQTWPQSVPRPGGSGLSSTELRIIIAAAVVIVLIIGSGVWYANFRDGGGDEPRAGSSASPRSGPGGVGGSGGKGTGGQEKAPADPASKLAFQVPSPKVRDVTVMTGSWITDTTYVKTGINQIVGYDLAKGTRLWAIPLPGQLCAASRHTKDGRTAIAFEAARRSATVKYLPCTEIGVIDLTAGKLLWSKSVKSSSSGDTKVRFSEVTLGATTVAAGGTDGGAAFDLATGAVRWKPEANAENCEDTGYGGGAGLVAVRRCGSYDDPQVSVQNLNPVTGAPISSYRMPPGVEYASIVSTVPLVVAADVGHTAGDGSGISDFFSIDGKTGALRAKIAAPGDTYAARCGSTEVETCGKLAVGNDRLYLPTEERQGGTDQPGSRTNEIVAFDLATGKATSDRADAGDRYTMFPLRMDGGNVIAYKWPPYDKGGQIVSIDGRSFRQTVLMENPSTEAVHDLETSFTPDYSEILYADGRMFVSEVLMGKPSAVSPETTALLALSYSTR